MLGVDGDLLAAGQFDEVDVMTAASELQRDAGIEGAFAHHALAQAQRIHQIDEPLLQHAGADHAFDVAAAVMLEDHRFDAEPVQEVREEQAGGAGADDADLRAHGWQLSLSTAARQAGRSRRLRIDHCHTGRGHDGRKMGRRLGDGAGDG